MMGDTKEKSMNEHVNQRFLSEAPVNLPANKRDPEYHSDATVELLSRLDVDYVFLLPGSSYRGLHDSLVNYGRNHKPKMVLTTHEQIAVSMAHGYAKATGRIGVCILHDLVGLMNGSMGVYNAFGDHAPVLVLGGSGPLDPADRRWIDWLHCASTQADIVKNYVKWSEEPTTPQWHLDAIAKAHRVALTAPRGPVYVTLDCGIQEQKIEGEVIMPDPKFFQPAPPSAANPDALAAAADALLNASLPVIVGGRFGINPAVTEPLVELVELTGAVYRDDNGVVAFPTAHPQSASGDREIGNQASFPEGIWQFPGAGHYLGTNGDQMHVAEDRYRPVENAWIGQRMVDPDIDHATVAKGYGAWAKGPIFDPAELAGVFKEAVAEVEKGRVAVVEVRTQLV
jgi:glyoxylate carboligase